MGSNFINVTVRLCDYSVGKRKKKLIKKGYLSFYFRFCSANIDTDQCDGLFWKSGTERQIYMGILKNDEDVLS